MAYLKQDFKDVEATPNYFKQRNKLGLDFPNLPYIKDNDYYLSETMAIHRYIANKYERNDLFGKTKLDKILIKSLEQFQLDFFNSIFTWVFSSLKDLPKVYLYLKT